MSTRIYTRRVDMTAEEVCVAIRDKRENMQAADEYKQKQKDERDELIRYAMNQLKLQPHQLIPCAGLKRQQLYNIKGHQETTDADQDPVRSQP